MTTHSFTYDVIAQVEYAWTLHKTDHDKARHRIRALLAGDTGSGTQVGKTLDGSGRSEFFNVTWGQAAAGYFVALRKLKPSVWRNLMCTMDWLTGDIVVLSQDEVALKVHANIHQDVRAQMIMSSDVEDSDTMEWEPSSPVHVKVEMSDD